MLIEWKIKKKRGNLRPELIYNVTLEEHEKALALPPLRIPSYIPKPKDSWQEFCYPGQMERSLSGGGKDGEEYYHLETPSHRGRSWSQSLRLPWRESNSYPEVEESFTRLRETFELELSKAYASQPMEEENSLESTVASKENIAPGVLAERFLQFARRQPQ